jgi:hypothetical protein
MFCQELEVRPRINIGFAKRKKKLTKTLWVLPRKKV